VMASQTFGSVETGRDFSQVMETLKTISASIVTVIVAATVLSRFLPSMPFLKDMVLAAPGARDATGALEPRLRPDVAAGTAALIGARGSTVTALRPAGKARIDDRLLDVVSNGPFIAAGCNVEVVSSIGNHVVVREV
jgi:membrane-bound serine protease (ClpP class)